MKKFSDKNTGFLRASDMRKANGKIAYGIILTVLIMGAIVCVLPTLWAVLSAFKDSGEIYTSTSFFPKNLTFTKAINRITDSWRILKLTDSFINTIIMAIGDLVFKVIVCGFGGYALSKIKPKGTKFIFALVVWTMMMPGQVRLVPNYISYLHFPFASGYAEGINLMDTFWPMWLGSAADTFAVLLFKNAFDALSESYVEAAKIDGCNDYGVFFRIMLPLSLPTIIFMSITTLSAVWSNFFQPLLYFDTKTVVPLQIYRMKGDASVKQNTYFMALIFASIPQFLIYLFFNKHIMGGVNVGGVKG